MPKKPRKPVKTGKRKPRYFLAPEDRKPQARKWLRSLGSHKELVDRYAKRYRIPRDTAYYELMELGYYDTLKIEAYENEGIEWEYMCDGYTGAMKVVPKGTPEWELHMFD